MAELIMKYQASEYEDKVTDLESYAERLNDHLEKLEGYQKEIPEFWTGREAEHYEELLTKYILACRDANERVADLKLMYSNAMEDMEQQSEAVDSIISGLTDAAGLILKL